MKSSYTERIRGASRFSKRRRRLIKVCQVLFNKKKCVRRPKEASSKICQSLSKTGLGLG